jgi:hypothetical protein
MPNRSPNNFLIGEEEFSLCYAKDCPWSPRPV